MCVRVCVLRSDCISPNIKVVFVRAQLFARETGSVFAFYAAKVGYVSICTCIQSCTYSCTYSCMYSCIHSCVYSCIYSCKFPCIYICEHKIRFCMYAGMHMHSEILIHTRLIMHADMHICTCMCTCIYTCICINIYLDTYIYIYIYI